MFLMFSEATDMPLDKPHVSWGGASVLHLVGVPEEHQEVGCNIYEETTNNSNLHRLVKHGDVKGVQEILVGRDYEQVRDLVSLTYEVMNQSDRIRRFDSNRQNISTLFEGEVYNLHYQQI